MYWAVGLWIRMCGGVKCIEWSPVYVGGVTGIDQLLPWHYEMMKHWHVRWANVCRSCPGRDNGFLVVVASKGHENWMSVVGPPSCLRRRDGVGGSGCGKYHEVSWMSGGLMVWEQGPYVSRGRVGRSMAMDSWCVCSWLDGYCEWCLWCSYRPELRPPFFLRRRAWPERPRMSS
jgi:hypothetical protein